MDSILRMSLMQLINQFPLLLVYLIGIILALVYWRRCPSACLFALIGSGLLLLSSLVWPFVFQYWLHSSMEKGLDHSRVGLTMAALGLAGSVIHAVGFGLLLAAVFTGRGSRKDQFENIGFTNNKGEH